jgi:hypothetical protein
MAYSDELWAEAKRKCRLNMEEIALAKRLGLNPRSLIKNIPNKSEPWKAPVKDWLHEIDAKRQKKLAQKQRRKENVKPQKALSPEQPETERRD